MEDGLGEDEDGDAVAQELESGRREAVTAFLDRRELQHPRQRIHGAGRRHEFEVGRIVGASWRRRPLPPISAHGASSAASCITWIRGPRASFWASVSQSNVIRTGLDLGVARSGLLGSRC